MAHLRRGRGDIAQILRSALNDNHVMMELRSLCRDWFQVFRMSDHEIIDAIAGFIETGSFHLIEPTPRIAWGKKVSIEFKEKVVDICNELGIETDFLMAAMAFESGETFRSDIKNAAGSGAVGLIQFMPKTAKVYGTSTDALSQMSAVRQLDYVELYFQHYKHRLKTIEDVYMAILWPAAIGKDNSFVLFDKDDTVNPDHYIQNKGLDLDGDGKVTKAEATSGVKKKLERGRTAEFFG
jgi:hypothetical protein